MLLGFVMAVVPRQLLSFRNCNELEDVVYSVYEDHLSIALGSAIDRTFGVLLSVRRNA